MYVPRHFANADLDRLDQLVARDAFATLISVHEGAPYASHLPMLYRRDAAQVRFIGHWAKANPQWRSITAQDAMLIVQGPHAYISPTWYPDPSHRVPTWNYAVAHIYGSVRLITDLAALEALVSELAEHYETRNGSAWRLADTAPDVRLELNGIVGFELTAKRIELKDKLNQHHPRENVEGAVQGLRGSGRAPEREVADLMEQALQLRQR